MPLPDKPTALSPQDWLYIEAVLAVRIQHYKTEGKPKLRKVAARLEEILGKVQAFNGSN